MVGMRMPAALTLALGIVVGIGWAGAAIAAGQAAPAQTATQPTDKVRVIVSILPQVYFVERIGGEFVDVHELVGPGQSPHSYDATPKQMEQISKAHVYFRIGVDAENTLVPRLEKMFKKLKIVDTRAGVPIRKMRAHEVAAHEHSHEDAHEHGHAHGEGHENCDHAAGTPDPHIWLNPLYVKTQAETICRALCELDAGRAEAYRRNLDAFQKDLDALHAQLTETLAPLKGRTILVFHPAFGYFTDAYGLKQSPVEIEGKEPSAKQLGRLIEQAKASGVKVIFVQPQFSTKSAEAVARAIGGAVVPMDDLPRDYMKALTEMAAKMKSALETK